MASTSKARSAGLWVLQIGVAGMMLMAAVPKLAGAEHMVATFEAIGLGQAFRYVTGGLEVLGAVLLLVPALAGAGALLLVAVMAGAVLTHLLLIGGSAVPAVVLLLASCVIAYGRRDATAALLVGMERRGTHRVAPLVDG
jgi:putative oxidoreductase